jgi:hypothetical protein
MHYWISIAYDLLCILIHFWKSIAIPKRFRACRKQNPRFWRQTCVNEPSAEGARRQNQMVSWLGKVAKFDFMDMLLVPATEV